MSYFMVDRQAYGGDYWERIEFGPFDTREEAEAFVDAGTVGLFHGGYVREVTTPTESEARDDS